MLAKQITSLIILYNERGESTMYEECENIYQRCRLSADLKQEKAAELLGKSVESIRAYESDKTIPPDSVVIEMSVIYNAPHLVHFHIYKTSIGKKILPSIEVKGFSQAVMGFLDEFDEMRNNIKALMSISKDDKLTIDEHELFRKISQDIEKLCQAGLEIKYSRKG